MQKWRSFARQFCQTKCWCMINVKGKSKVRGNVNTSTAVYNPDIREPPIYFIFCNLYLQYFIRITLVEALISHTSMGGRCVTVGHVTPSRIFKANVKSLILIIGTPPDLYFNYQCPLPVFIVTSRLCIRVQKSPRKVNTFNLA